MQPKEPDESQPDFRGIEPGSQIIDPNGSYGVPVSHLL